MDLIDIYRFIFSTQKTADFCSSANRNFTGLEHEKPQ